MAKDGEIDLQGEDWKMNAELAWSELQRFITIFRPLKDYQADTTAILLLDFIGELGILSNTHIEEYKEISNLTMFIHMQQSLTICLDNVNWIIGQLRKGMN